MTDSEALRVLRLEASASEEEIKQTFRRLAKVWHPDRFMEDPQLRARAQERLREIIAARQTLQGYDARRPRPGANGTSPNQGWRPPPPPPGGWPETPRQRAMRRKPRHHPVLAMVVCVALVLGLFHAANLPEAPIQPWAASPQATIAQGEPSPAHPIPVKLVNPSPADSPQAREKTKPKSKPNPPAAGKEPGTQADFFTLGDTQDRVEVVQGPPTSSDDWVWKYGASSVYFSQGRVAGWDSSPSHPLRAKMPAHGIPGQQRGYFTLGSSSEELLAVQGTPSILEPTVWHYGLSKVYLHEGRVTGWDVARDDPLKARMVGSDQAAKHRGYFSVGSSVDEVAAVQGTPSSLSERVWKFGTSSVYFSEGRVSSWEIMPRHPLKARMVPSSAANLSGRSFFTVGSSADEVIAIQGTPTSFNETAWRYGHSTVYFKDGRVLRWYSSPSNPIRAKLRSELMFGGYY